MFIRLKYKFWALQPVFHFYDVYYWFINVGVIRKELPEKNKYVNLKKIVTKEFEKIDELIKKQIVTLIRLNYLRNGENVFNPNNSTYNYNEIWTSVQSLVKVRQYLNSNPNATVKLFLYTPSVGIGNPAEWDWIIVMKN